MLLDLLYSEDIDIKDLEKYFLASSQGQAPGFSPKNFITNGRTCSNHGTNREDKTINWKRQIQCGNTICALRCCNKKSIG